MNNKQFSTSSVFCCLFLFCFLWFASAQDVWMDDGCYYYNDVMLGCIKATVNECDNNWSYIITNPLFSNTNTGKVLLSDGLVGIGERFASCFPMENGNNCCLNFQASRYENHVLTVPTTVIIRPLGEDDITFDVKDLVASGISCGEVGTFSQHCPGFGPQLSHYSFLHPNTIKYLFDSVKDNNYEDLFYLSETDACLYAKQYETVLGPFVCPRVLYDSCGSAAALTSSSGITFIEMLSEENEVKICVEFENFRSFCIEPLDFIIDDNSVSGSIRFTVEYLASDVIYYSETIPSTAFEFSFPDCGVTMMNCIREESSIFAISPLSPLSFSFPSISTYSSFGTPFILYPADHENSPHSRSGNSNESFRSSSSNTGTGVLFVIATAVSILAAIIVVVVVLLIDRNRRARRPQEVAYELVSYSAD